MNAYVCVCVLGVSWNVYVTLFSPAPPVLGSGTGVFTVSRGVRVPPLMPGVYSNH